MFLQEVIRNEIWDRTEDALTCDTGEAGNHDHVQLRLRHRWQIRLDHGSGNDLHDLLKSLLIHTRIATVTPHPL